MNLRILKKLSKRAAPLLPLPGDARGQFPAAKWECYVSVGISDWKHWERTRAQYPFEHEMKRRPRDGKGWIVMRQPSHPWKGTVMVGAMSGYCEPEWDEESAWESLRGMVFDHFTDWTEDGPVFQKRDLSTPKLVFAAAHEMVEAAALARKDWSKNG